MIDSTLNIAIVGAGVMGRTLAWQLLLDAKSVGKKLQIQLFDKDPIDNGSAAAYTAAGMLTPYCELESAEAPVFDMGQHALTLWPKLAESLGDTIDFHQEGSLVVAHPQDRADYLRFLQQVRAKQEIKANQDFEFLDDQAINQKCDGIGQFFSEAIFFPSESWVDTHLYLLTIGKRLQDASNLQWHAQEDVRLIENQSEQVTLTTRRKVYTFDQVIDCRGLNAKKDMPDLRGVRGEVITLFAPEVNIPRMVRLMHPRYRLYLVPRSDHTYLLGATQIESEDKGEITVRSALELLSAAYSLHPGFAEARVIKTATNCRPALRDNLPRIEVHDKIIRINGLFRHGYLLAPVIAVEATNKILDSQQPSRFPKLFHYLNS